MSEPVLIAVVSQKGGAGKTTITMQLAAALAELRRSVAVADLDPQESAVRWSACASRIPPVPKAVFVAAGTAKAISRTIAQRAHGVHLVLLDCPPSIEHPHTMAALGLASFVLVPVVPGPTDLWSTRAVEKFIQSEQQKRPSLRAALLPNRVQRTAVAADVLEVLHEFALPLMPVAVAQRSAYAQSAIVGGSVFHLGSAARVAQDEMLRLAAAVLKQLGTIKS